MRLQETINRRQFLRGAGIGAAGLTGAALLGCGSSEPPTPRIVQSEIDSTPTPIAEFRIRKNRNSPWESATGKGEDGKQHHLTSQYFLPTISVDDWGHVTIPLKEEGGMILQDLMERASKDISAGMALQLFVDGETLPPGTIVSTSSKDEKPYLSITSSNLGYTKQLAARLREEAEGRGKNKGSHNTVENSRGVEKFRSLNYPYEIQYPKDWTAQSTQIKGQKVDVYKGETIEGFQTNINVLSESVESWVTTEDYAKNYTAKLKEYAPNAVNVSEIKALMAREEKGESVAVRGWGSFGRAISQEYGDKSLVDQIINLADVKVSNNKIAVTAATIPEGAIIANPQLYTFTALLVNRGQAWQITVSLGYDGNSAEHISDSLNKFRKGLESFTLLTK